MNGVPEFLDKVLDSFVEKTQPESVFLYGSRARGDYNDNSDFELGALYKGTTLPLQSDIRSIVRSKKVNIYAFEYEQFVCGNPDTPFPKSVYLRELCKSAATLRGSKVIEKLAPPPVRVSDLLEVSSFEVAYSVASVLSFKKGDVETASKEFVKSILFGSRALVILKLKKFPLKYQEIVSDSMLLDIDASYCKLIKTAFNTRRGGKFDCDDLYMNVRYLNQVVLETVKAELEGGNRKVIE